MIFGSIRWQQIVLDKRPFAKAMPLPTYAVHFTLLYVIVAFLSVPSKAGSQSKIVRPSALDFEEVNTRQREGKRYRGGETPSDRIRRKKERLKREQHIQTKREFDELPNRVKNYNRREDNARNHKKSTTTGLKSQVRDAEDLEADVAAELDKARDSLNFIKKDVYHATNESIEDPDDRLVIEIQNSLAYHRKYRRRTGVENRTLRFFYGTENDAYVDHPNIHEYGHSTQSHFRWSLYGSKNVHKCPASCSGHGICRVDKCHCYRMWDGVDCSLRKCPSGRAYMDREYYDHHDDTSKKRRVVAYAVCSGRGYCNRINGTCACLEGYEGTACERSICPSHACNGHGRCVRSYGSGSAVSCICEAPFYGPDCFLQRCPRGDNPKTYIMDKHGPKRNGVRRFNVHAIEISSSIPDVTGWFTLSFKGYHQIEHETRPIPWHTYHRLHLDTEKALYAEHIRKALLMLPNYLFPDVEVSLVSATNGIGFLVTFVAETANITDGFTVNHLGCDYTGCQPRYTGLYTSGRISVHINETYETSNVENAECSNQGICHPTTGFCTCNEGFKGPACSIYDEYS